jgi:hypothetical protein
MAFNKTPTAWIPGWSADANDVTFPIASVPELDAAEANETTGDIRRILFALLEHIASVNSAVEAADRSKRMTINKSVMGNLTNSESLDYTYMIKLQMEPTGIEVAEE